MFGVPERTVTRWEQDGTLECLRLPSGVRRYFCAQVEALLRDEPLTQEQVRAVREELTALAKGRPLGCIGKDS